MYVHEIIVRGKPKNTENWNIFFMYYWYAYQWVPSTLLFFPSRQSLLWFDTVGWA